MNRTSLRLPALGVAVALAGATFALAACQPSGSGAEQLAAQLAASASAEKSARLEEAKKPDPAMEKFKARKDGLEHTVQDLKTDEGLIMAGDPKATPGILRRYFPAGGDGDKPAKELEDKRKKEGHDGYRVVKATVNDTRLESTLDAAEIEYLEHASSRGNVACLLLVERWKLEGERWVFRERKSAKKVDCP